MQTLKNLFQVLHEAFSSYEDDTNMMKDSKNIQTEEPSLEDLPIMDAETQTQIETTCRGALTLVNNN